MSHVMLWGDQMGDDANMEDGGNKRLSLALIMALKFSMMIIEFIMRGRGGGVVTSAGVTMGCNLPTPLHSI